MTEYTDYGLLHCLALLPNMEKIYDQGLTSGSSTGFKSLDQNYTVSPSQWTLITGIPGHGKSEFLDSLLVNLMMQDWTFAVYSPENQPCELHLAKLCEKYLKLPFRDGPTRRMSKSNMESAVRWLNFKMTFINPKGEQPKSIDDILYSSWAWFEAMGQNQNRGIVIDPWN